MHDSHIALHLLSLHIGDKHAHESHYNMNITIKFMNTDLILGGQPYA